jgi:hypothetical protein
VTLKPAKTQSPKSNSNHYKRISYNNIVYFMNYSFVIILLCIWSFILVKSRLSQNKRQKDLNNRDNDINRKHRDLDTKSKQLLLEIEKKSIQESQFVSNKKLEFETIQIAKKNEFERLLQEAKLLKSEFEKGFLNGRNWLSNAFSDYIRSKDDILECSLIVKPNPALKSAEIVSELKKSRAEMAKKLKFLEFQLNSYEEYFPQLLEYKYAILEELIDFQNYENDENIDPALFYGFISKEEYDTLSSQQKFQVALDRYWKKEKTNLEIGRLYERYIGYIYESNGWNVKYEGIIKGFEDFGRDLICEKDGKHLIVQCKCWSKDKVIREKYIMQLFGSTILYGYENKIDNVIPIFYSTTSLSDEASIVANKLGVEFVNEQLKRYPMIKCNVNNSDKEKIYHLPFDQQYDRIVIGDNYGESYVDTIEQAEKLGFRRAYKWSGNSNY